LIEYGAKHGWDSVEIKMCLSMSCRSGARQKIEVLTANYPIAGKIKE
jgi:hypothetical protein